LTKTKIILHTILKQEFQHRSTDISHTAEYLNTKYCFSTDAYIPLSLQRVLIARNADRCNIYGLSVRPSVRLSVTFRCFVQMNEDTIVRFPASGRTIILVSTEVKFIRIFAGNQTPSEGVM